MSEPRDPFDRFDTEGFAVTPLPPSEVRRQGDRLRRRRNAAGVVAGVAAVALIATPIGLIAGGDDSASPAPAPPGAGWLTTIPDDFPLLVGVENDPEGSDPTISPDDEGLESIALCAQEVWPADSVDRLAGEDPAMDYHFRRELLLLPGDAEAKAALARIRERLAECGSEVTTDGAVPDMEFELVHTAYDKDTPADETVTWTDAFADGSIHTKVFQFVRVGNAIAGTEVSSEADKDGVVSQLPMVTSGSRQLVDAMCIFAADPCDPPSETPAPQPVDGADIPESFPLASGFPTESEREDPVKGPRTDLTALDFQACGSPVPDLAPEDRLFASYTNAEDFRSRWLTTYADATAAQAALTAMIESWQSCPVDPERGDGYATDREVRPIQVGDEGWAILERDTFGGAESIFGATTVIVRIGNAVFLEDRGGHSGYPYDDGTAQIQDITSSAKQVITRMCIFGEGDCGTLDEAALTAADLIDPEETQPRYESSWETRDTYAGDQGARNFCFSEGVVYRGASTLWRRDFDMFGPQGKTDGDWMTAVVADFPDAAGAAAAYHAFAQDMALCEERMGREFAGNLSLRDATTVELVNVAGEARAYFATYPFTGAADAVTRMETGMALVGTRVVILTTVSGPFERVDPPSPTAMEVMLVQAAERLTPGPAGPITPTIQMF